VESVVQALSLNGAGFHSRYRIHKPGGALNLSLSLPGEHNLMNALAAVAAAEALGVDNASIGPALQALGPVQGRMQPVSVPSGARLIDDSYNANPDSVRAALDVLRQLPGCRWLVLGDLAELGQDAGQLHLQVGRQAKRAGVQRLWAVGPLSRAAVKGFGEGGRHFAHGEELIAALSATLGSDDVVLVKGSRSAAMERVVGALAHRVEG
jgi:UDP-N-acetylmuramoyl-tripeptide--D-alanyl-D-alanine ligase